DSRGGRVSRRDGHIFDLQSIGLKGGFSMKFVRFQAEGRTGFGVLSEEGEVRVYEGDMFHRPRPSGLSLALDRVKLLIRVVGVFLVGTGISLIFKVLA
ncbi:DUF2437 domain-containing protein, partial [Streptococcus pneumoniae]|uniref:DUF2437 domain-containing protein n=1 Tax=Streptococcus pneumoniae TaxID=1313 RepID=UPI00122F17AD